MAKYQAKHFRKRQRNMKAVVLVAACLTLLLCSVGGVWAYLLSKTGTVTNTFVPAEVTCAVEETFQDGVKSDVKIRNTGNIDAYIRAMVVVTFVSEEGKVLAVSPKEGVDYTVTWSNGGWKQGADGFWYYADPVSPDQLTANLIETASAQSAPTGYRLNIQIIATAIQSDPADAVQNAWGVTPTNGKLILH